MYGRRHNAFSDSSHVDLDAMSFEALDQRLAELTRLVYPAIGSRAAKGNLLPGAPSTQPPPPAETTFPAGSFVMCKDELRVGKSQPPFLGPFKVLRRNRGGAYVLMDAAGNQIKRAPEALKAVPMTRSFGTSSTVERILALRGERRNHEYLVRWQGQDSTHDEWLKPSDFDGPAIIQSYWKRQLGAMARPA